MCKWLLHNSASVSDNRRSWWLQGVRNLNLPLTTKLIIERVLYMKRSVRDWGSNIGLAVAQWWPTMCHGESIFSRFFNFQPGPLAGDITDESFPSPRRSSEWKTCKPDPPWPSMSHGEPPPPPPPQCVWKVLTDSVDSGLLVNQASWSVPKSFHTDLLCGYCVYYIFTRHLVV